MPSMTKEGVPPPENIPVLWGDYNVVGLSGEEGDNCIYSLHKVGLEKLLPYEGMLVFVYDDDVNENEEPEVFGYVCSLESVTGFNSSWRARPNEATWYRGPQTWSKS